MALLEVAATVVWVHTGPFDEEVVFGYHTGFRNGGDRDALLAAADSWWTTDLTADFKCRVTLRQLRYLVWNSALGRWQQTRTLEVSRAGTVAAMAPPQCAVAASLRLTDNSIPLRRRYNRAYHGYLGQAIFESTDGRLLPTPQANLQADVQQLHDRFQAIPAGVAGLEGLCVASQAGNFVLPATEVGVGRVVDTQRRRRADYPDDKTWAALV